MVTTSWSNQNAFLPETTGKWYSNYELQIIIQHMCTLRLAGDFKAVSCFLILKRSFLKVKTKSDMFR